MSSHAAELLGLFELLADDGKRAFTVEFVRRAAPFDSGELDDSDTADAAERLLASVESRRSVRKCIRPYLHRKVEPLKREGTGLLVLGVAVGAILIACGFASSCSRSSKNVQSAASPVIWAGLSFGMTPDQVRTAMRGHLYDDHTKAHEAGTDGEGEHLYTINVHGVTVDKFKAEAAIIFNEDRKLTEVDLYLLGADRLEPLDRMTRIQLVADISNLLLERCGKPVGETGEVPGWDQLSHYYLYRKPDDSFYATRAWKSAGAFVKEALRLDGEAGSFIISYELDTHEL